MLGISVGTCGVRRGSDNADAYVMDCTARAVFHRICADSVRIIFLSSLAEEAAPQSVTRITFLRQQRAQEPGLRPTARGLPAAPHESHRRGFVLPRQAADPAGR